ncbi:MAG TPA: FtsX-like permease family protein [Armatimonadota bacterium]|jgi:hypothetical protein
MTEKRPSKLGNGLAALGFAVITIVAIVFWLRGFAPKPYEAPLEPFRGYDRTALSQAMLPAAVRTKLDGLLACGSRFMGQPGFYKAEQYLKDQYQADGLQVYEQEMETPAPHTDVAQAFSATNQPLPVKLYPFQPNQMQPMATPAAGLTGELVLLNDTVMRTRPSFRGCIGLIDNSQKSPAGFDYDWIKYAQLGLSALIVTHPGGLEKISWPSMGPMASQNPVNYVRLAASPEILQYAGQQIRLQVKVTYQATTTRNIIGVLKGSGDNKEAIVVSCAYDTPAILPDASPGAVSGLPVATQLSLAAGLAPYRAQLRRDVIFVSTGAGAMGQDGLTGLLGAVGTAIDPAGRRAKIVENQKSNDLALKQVTQIAGLFGTAQFGADAAATEQALTGLDPATRTFFDNQTKYVLNTLVFELSEDLLQAKIGFERAGGKDFNSQEYAAFQAVKRNYDQAFSAAGYSLPRLLSSKAQFTRDYRIRDRVLARFTELLKFHQTQQMRLNQGLQLHEVFAHYSSVMVVAPLLTPSAAPAPQEVMSFSMGLWVKHGEQAQAFRNLLTDAIQTLKLDKQVSLDFVGKDQGGHVKTLTASYPLQAELWTSYSYPSFSVVNAKGLYTEMAAPVEYPYSRQVDSVKNSLQVLGEATLSGALGNGRFNTMVVAKVAQDFFGQVLVSGVGESLIPNYPLKNAVVCCKKWALNLGYSPVLVLMTDPYGRYSRMSAAASLIPEKIEGYTPDAAGYGPDGAIAYIKDEGLSAQSVYKSMMLRVNELTTPVNIVTYRGNPVSILDMTNPQTFKPFTAAAPISSKTLSGFPNSNLFIEDNLATNFIKPDEPFYMTLKAGSVQNELVQTIRAFMLGTTPEQALRADPGVATLGHEINGGGYLPADQPLLLSIPLEIAKSMAYVNGQRLAVGGKYHLFDERTIRFHEKSLDLIKQGLQPTESQHTAILLGRDAATYAELNHPVLKQTIGEAVVGILWYLGLLVPFVFFFEKLVFGFTDIRKQLITNLIIFLVVFALLRTLHPAFAMLRSSTMILLGFIIFLFSAGITVLFWGKFQANLEEIKRQRGQVTAAEVNRMGVVGTAFMLGLNNMHRRRLRTGFTCATLVLLTFVMICFTSVRSDIVEQATAVGKAAYSGFVVKNEKFIPLSDAELFAMRTKYGEKFSVAPRLMYVGIQEWPALERSNPKLEMLYNPNPTTSRSVTCDSILQFGAHEPLAPQMKFLTPNCWFTEDQERAQGGDIPVIISDAAATKLGITPPEVEKAPVPITLNGQKVLVQGIFDSAALGELTDLDGKTLLPFDVTAFATVNKNVDDIIAEDTDPRMNPERVILAPARLLGMTVDTSKLILNSVAVVLPDGTPYKSAKAVIDDFLEESGKATYYGVDSYAFLGKRARQSTLAGSIDMLIPLIIAALTVLNTMKGSVYERREEIFVYNAVGIAPRYIFFMFFAEAFVYAVVGSVLGYLLSQGTGTILTALGQTGGMNMTFTSATTIYASLAIAAAVFASTYYPAKSAMQIAAPAEDSGWQLPEPVGDVITFSLPFTFSSRDRIAILSFFRRYLLDHGEGSSGAFFAGKPLVTVSERRDPLADDGYIPILSVPIWLKPFDLGVSQELIILLPTDPQTGEYIANIELVRRSGTLENWKRVNHHFVTLLRRHFLYWRAVSPDERLEMFEEAKTILVQNLEPEEGRHG